MNHHLQTAALCSLVEHRQHRFVVVHRDDAWFIDFVQRPVTRGTDSDHVSRLFAADVVVRHVMDFSRARAAATQVCFTSAVAALQRGPADLLNPAVGFEIVRVEFGHCGVPSN